MQKLTDIEFEMVCSTLRKLDSVAYANTIRGVRKLLANYQEQLEAESLNLAAARCHIVQGQTIVLERYTEANCATTELCVEVEP